MQQLTREQKMQNCEVMIKAILNLKDDQLSDNLVEFANLQLIQHGPSDPEACGCIGGWVAQHPHFTQYGIYADPDDGAPLHNSSLFPSDISEMLFGNSTLFCGAMPHERKDTAKNTALQRLHNTVLLLNEL